MYMNVLYLVLTILRILVLCLLECVLLIVYSANRKRGKGSIQSILSILNNSSICRYHGRTKNNNGKIYRNRKESVSKKHHAL